MSLIGNAGKCTRMHPERATNWQQIFSALNFFRSGTILTAVIPQNVPGGGVVYALLSLA